MASTTVGALIVKLTAQTRQFDTAMARAPKQLGGLQRATSAASVALTAMATKLVAVAAAYMSVHKAAAGIQSEAARLDEIGKYSDRIGIAVEELQRLHHVAGLSGVEINALHMALQKMVGNISEAATGTGEAKDALAELGLEAAKMAQLAPDKQFLAIGRALEKVSSQTEKVRLLGDITGERGVKLLQMYVDLQAKMADADLLRIASRSEIAAVEGMNDAWMRATESMRNAFTTMTIDLEPAITKTANAVAYLARQTNKSATGWKWLHAYGAGLEAVLRPGNAEAQQRALNATLWAAGIERNPRTPRKPQLPSSVVDQAAAMDRERELSERLFGYDMMIAANEEAERSQRAIMGRARQRLSGMIPGMAAPGPSAAKFTGATGGIGSAEFYEAGVRARFRAPPETIQKDILATIKQQLETDQRREELAEKMLEKLTPQEIMAIGGGP